jgi:hypothetical protein
VGHPLFHHYLPFPAVCCGFLSLSLSSLSNSKLSNFFWKSVECREKKYRKYVERVEIDWEWLLIHVVIERRALLISVHQKKHRSKRAAAAYVSTTNNEFGLASRNDESQLVSPQLANSVVGTC